jgi:hypothetical protein
MKMLLVGILTALSLGATGAALAQPAPGTPLVAPCFSVFEIREGILEQGSERFGPLSLGCLVAGGFVVLLDVDGPNQRLDPRNWSDVVAFTTGGPPQPGQPTDVVWMISDAVNPATGLENGVSLADLASIGVSPADIIANPTTVFIMEGLNPLAPDQNEYDVSLGGAVVKYLFYSDPPEGPTATHRDTWGRIKTLYR